MTATISFLALTISLSKVHDHAPQPRAEGRSWVNKLVTEPFQVSAARLESSYLCLALYGLFILLGSLTALSTYTHFLSASFDSTSDSSHASKDFVFFASLRSTLRFDSLYFVPIYYLDLQSPTSGVLTIRPLSCCLLFRALPHSKLPRWFTILPALSFFANDATDQRSSLFVLSVAIRGYDPVLVIALFQRLTFISLQLSKRCPF